MKWPVAKIFAYPTLICCGVTNEDAPCFRIVSTILDLLEQGLNWLLGIPSPAHVLEVDLEVDRGDVPVDKLLPLPQPPVRARPDTWTSPSAQRANQLRRVLARVYAVSIQNQITTTVP
jgi:hypothetical protein